MGDSNYCTLLVSYDKIVLPTQAEVQAELESPEVPRKIGALKKCIMMILAGEDMSKLLMSVIRFCITVEDHELKKLLMYFWEVVKKYDASGNPKPEMILVCNALRNDLNHPNEFIRGCTLRFLCKIKEKDLLVPLVASIKMCLSHRHHYVRRNAVLTVYTLYKNFPDLIPDAPTDIMTFLDEETDSAARRNAFIMLFNCQQDLAIEYFVAQIDSVQSFGDGFALIVLELCRKVCRTDPSQKQRFMSVIFNMLNSSSPAVVFEAAGTVVSLSRAAPVIAAAASAYTELLNKESDNNVKLIVLERLAQLQRAHPQVLRDQVMDVLRALSSPNEDIQRKTLQIGMALVSTRNVEEVMALLKKEILATQASDSAQTKSYREMLVRAIHDCAVRFPEIAHSVVLLLMDFLGSDGAPGVMLFVREIVETYPDLREAVLSKMMEVMGDIKQSEVFRVALWILGQYCDDEATLHAALSCVKENVGDLPILPEAGARPGGVHGAGKVAPTAAGAGASADAESAEPSADSAAPSPTLRSLLAKGDFFLGAVVSSTLTKLCLRTQEIHGADSRDSKAVLVGAMLVMCGIIELGQTPGSAAPIDQDSFEHICMCIRMLADPLAHRSTGPHYRALCRSSFQSLIKARREASSADEEEKKAEASMVSEADDLIPIRQLRGRRAATAVEVEMDDEADIIKATGSTTEEFSSRLQRVHQLSGFADPVYAEAYVTVHDYDIVLKILIINRTDATLTNLAVELATIGDLKLVERPQAFTLGPHDSRTLTANIKVSSTETGEIFGTLVFDSSSSATEKTVINLNDIKIDILDYIKPATCSESTFRSFWADFEWENKVAVNTRMTNLQEFVQHIVKSTNMRSLTPIDELDSSCNFLAANLYAKSIFGEDALVNVSVENRMDGSIRGHIRIRSKTQGVALSLGDKITETQKGPRK